MAGWIGWMTAYSLNSNQSILVLYNKITLLSNYQLADHDDTFITINQASTTNILLWSHQVVNHHQPHIGQLAAGGLPFLGVN